ncbi:hypothetical protein CRG98_035648 [Punica granatum]|uniref:BED-type domain-containing protein n=1 Tax=Punica granatum TaxID=22663 RepID=A0A2I0IJ20_PUNGR|nr:hypothetical protein CRG98_035648 [Punica granatum]
MGKQRDKFWDHAEVMPNEDKAKDRWKCKFCRKLFSGGASRIKAHLGKVEGKGIQVCESEVDEATMKEANEALEKITKRRKVDAGTDSTQVNPQQVAADLRITLPSPGQSNPNALAPLQQCPDPIHLMGLPLLFASRDNLDNISNSDNIFGDSSANILREVCDGAEMEDPSNAHVYKNERSSLPCSSFVTEAADRSGWPEHSTPQVEDLPPLQEDLCSSYVHELQVENANALSLEIQSAQPDGHVLLPENVQPSLLQSTRNVPPRVILEVNSCGDNPVQGEPDLVVEDHEANSIMLEQTNHFDPMRIDTDPNNEGNGDSASDLPSSALNSFARETTQCEMLAPKLVGQERIVDETLGSDLPHNRKIIAEDIVKECKGLPLAVVVMAGSMRGEVEDHVWEATLENLKRPGVLQQSMKESVFPILVHSYNRLDEKKQLCFSLCALYPEDWSIPRQELIELCIDQGVIREDRRRKMYNEGHRLLDELEKACLLEAYSAGGRGVRMHDVIRDMALHIMNANNAPCMVKSGLGLEDMPDDEEWLPNLQMVSLMRNDITVVPPSISPKCPQLATLLLSDCRLRKISKRFFLRMQGLKVIDLRSTSITEMPESVMNLKNLNALVLSRCSELSHIPSLAKLTSLRKLDLMKCRKIKEVPDGLGMLVNLTYLSLRKTSIERIPDGVVCKLKKLQHLEADNIAVKGEEVGKLRKLEALRCRFKNVNELNEYTLRSTTIESYSLAIGARTNLDYWHGEFAYGDVDLNFYKVIIMDEGEYKIGETCHLPRDVKLLWIRGYGGTWNISNFMGLEELEELRITGCDETITVHNCKEMKEVIGGQELDHRATSSLFLSPIPASSHGDQLSTRKLSLYLSLLPELKSICSWTGLRDFIHVIKIHICPKLKRIEMLDDASPPPSLEQIVITEVDRNRGKQWLESLEWVHPEAKTTLEPYVFVLNSCSNVTYPFSRYTEKFLLQECRS